MCCVVVLSVFLFVCSFARVLVRSLVRLLCFGVFVVFCVSKRLYVCCVVGMVVRVFGWLVGCLFCDVVFVRLLAWSCDGLYVCYFGLLVVWFALSVGCVFWDCLCVFDCGLVCGCLFACLVVCIVSFRFAPFRFGSFGRLRVCACAFVRC